MNLRDSALLLLGHGSTLNAHSSAPTYQHAEEIRRREIFAEVQVGFWKEEPNFRQALRQIDCARVYVVPNFISSGYFTEQVIPRELGLTGEVSHVGTQQIVYCQPVGLHPAMQQALLQRAREIVNDSGEAISEPAKTACLFICGHGTSFNDNSTKIIHEQAQAIRALGLFADCQAVLMEQTPFVKDWRMLTSCLDVIVVPFFISDGLHSFEDIPVLLGLKPGAGGEPFDPLLREGDRRLWYSKAIGTERFLADVILAQVEKAAAENKVEILPTEGSPSRAELVSSCLADEHLPWTIGQVAVLPDFSMRHVDDSGVEPANLRTLASLQDIREWIRLDADGKFRPLRAAPNLRQGWTHSAGGIEGALKALDYFYPAEMANGNLWQNGTLPITSWQETAERQTGRFRIVRKLDQASLTELVEQTCKVGCLKKRLWSPAGEDVVAAANEWPLLCPEACNFLVGKAREKLAGSAEE